MAIQSVVENHLWFFMSFTPFFRLPNLFVRSTWSRFLSRSFRSELKWEGNRTYKEGSNAFWTTVMNYIKWDVSPSYHEPEGLESNKTFNWTQPKTSEICKGTKTYFTTGFIYIIKSIVKTLLSPYVTVMHHTLCLIG